MEASPTTDPLPPEAPATQRVRALFVSDVHLGTRASRAAELAELLRRTECDELFLVGDFVDGWSLRKSWYWSEDHNRVLQEVLRKSSSGTRVVLVVGNHDEFLRAFLGNPLGGVEVVLEAEHTTADGRRLLVIHGDDFDATLRSAKWLALLGDRAFEVLNLLNHGVNALRRALGLRGWSIAKWLRGKVKDAIAYVETFERAAVEHARERGYDGVVCGHIHHARLRELPSGVYANTGDWVESRTALVERADGGLELWSPEPLAGPPPLEQRPPALEPAPPAPQPSSASLRQAG